ncbi:hypothetical protein FOCC_FOCC007463 [Frankliniella occidentalis]|nr:hypothetical protein FOCC_FOCC007463 [Frankliniella occidentalis]
MGKAKKSGRECTRLYQSRWQDEYCCCSVDNKTVCVICKHEFTLNKETNIRRHYSTKHSKAWATVRGAERSSRVLELRHLFVESQRVLRAADTFFLLRDEIKQFLKSIGQPTGDLDNKQWVEDLAFLVDITGHLNDLNKKLQGKAYLITDMYRDISAFQDKLTFWTAQVTEKGDFSHFPSVSALGPPSARLKSLVGKALKNLQLEFTSNFTEFKTLQVELGIFADPFHCDVGNAPVGLQMELLEIRNDLSLKAKFNSLPLVEFVRFVTRERFPHLYGLCAKILAMFGSTYVCEQFFSKMKLTKNSFRSRLSDSNLVNQLRVMTASRIEPDVMELVLEKRRQISGAVPE